MKTGRPAPKRKPSNRLYSATLLPPNADDGYIRVNVIGRGRDAHERNRDALRQIRNLRAALTIKLDRPI
jgi:hypothetical protein